MATRGDTRISSRPPPTDDGPGLLGRLLQRTRSKKGRTQPSDKGDRASNYGKGGSGPRIYVSGNAALATSPQPGRHTIPAPAPAPQTSTMRATMAQQQPPAPPMLRKRPSIRDRFRTLTKEASPQAPQLEKQRLIYVPTHAAADFSRLALSPKPSSRQQQHYSDNEPQAIVPEASEPLVPIASLSAEDESQKLAAIKHYSPRGLETLDENEPVQVTAAQHQKGRREPETHAPQLISATSATPQQRQGHAVIVDIGKRPSNHTRKASEQDPFTGTPPKEEPEQVSDYELFVARAEERERAYREHLLRTLSQRQYPRPEPEASSYQYHNSETLTADSAVVAEASGPLRKGREARLSGLDSGIGSKNSSQKEEGSRRQLEDPATGGSSTWERGHRKEASWTPSFGAGGNDAERNLDRWTSAVPELDDRAYTTSHSNAAPFADRSYAAQQPRTLKRQTSIKHKLGAYIKPARPLSRYEEPELRRGNSKRVIGA